MNKKFAIQNELDKKYWHWISGINWTDDILEAKLFDNKQEMERYIKNNRELKGISIIVIEVELPFISESYMRNRHFTTTDRKAF